MNFIYPIVQGKIYPPKDTKPDFSGRNVIVTGANTGLGFEAALKFVQLGAAKVILTSRSEEKGQAAKDEIEKRTGRKGVAEVWSLDLLDYDSIKAFAKRADTLDHLDIAVLNAGVVTAKYEKSGYGWERTLQVNVISTVALAVLLLPKLRQSRTEAFVPVLEFVNSAGHTLAQTAPQVLDGSVDPLKYYNEQAHYQEFPQYTMSKLLQMFVIQQLASMVVKADGKPEVYVIAVCPGACRSEISRDKTGVLISIAKFIVFSVFRSAEQGSRTYISGVTVGEQGHGRFWVNDEIRPQFPILVGDAAAGLQKRVCESVVNALKADIPQVSALVR